MTGLGDSSSLLLECSSFGNCFSKKMHAHWCSDAGCHTTEGKFMAFPFVQIGVLYPTGVWQISNNT